MVQHCKCFMGLKAFVPLLHIVDHTKPEIMAQFPASLDREKRSVRICLCYVCVSQGPITEDYAARLSPRITSSHRA